MGVHWKDWCWSWNSNTLTTSCKELTHWKRPCCWEGLGVGGKGDDRGWDGWMVSPTRWTWVWVNSGSLWWTGRPGVLRFMGSQRVGNDWATELNWDIYIYTCIYIYIHIVTRRKWISCLELLSGDSGQASLACSIPPLSTRWHQNSQSGHQKRLSSCFLEDDFV